MTTFGRETAEKILEGLLVAGARKRLAPEVMEEVTVQTARVVDEMSADLRKDLREFVAWWMRILHQDHRGTYPEPDWRKCPSNVCRSTAESFRDLKAPEPTAPEIRIKKESEA